ncbi:hypothetical protein DN068_15255 [Taibaiella soli]|uniref:Uncharacterized protein n=2 Tax=Taibaiella soli TaxID=1649169 RepID=A0A2W2AID7_9BACT|nr:hypothetical protein DN068_15255 [Taibaiella soli]
MRQHLAMFFLLIFSFQVLPVKEIGKLLFKSTTTEEIHEGHADDGPDLKIKKEGDPFHVSFMDMTSTARAKEFTAKVLLVIHRTASLPDYHIPDILTPPPNC